MASKISLAIKWLKTPARIASALALAYGVWAALVDAAGPNRLIVPVALEHTAKVELFYDLGEGFRTEDSTNQIVAAGTELFDVSLPVPRQPIKAVRFDPMDSAGHFTLGQPRLETASGRFIAKFPMAALAPANEIADFKVDGKQWTGHTTPEATDPQVRFNLGGTLKVGAPRVPWIEGVVLLLAFYLPWRFQEAPAEAVAAKQES